MVEVAVQLPDEIARQYGVVPGEIQRSLLEAIAAEGYRSAKLSRAQVGQLLQISAPQTDEFLANCEWKDSRRDDANGSQRDFQAFREALPNLLDKEPGWFVAVSGGKIIDRDSDEFSLVERVAREHPDQQVLIQPVAENGLVDVHMDTRGSWSGSS